MPECGTHTRSTWPVLQQGPAGGHPALVTVRMCKERWSCHARLGKLQSLQGLKLLQVTEADQAETGGSDENTHFQGAPPHPNFSPSLPRYATSEGWGEARDSHFHMKCYFVNTPLPKQAQPMPARLLGL